MLVIIRRAYCLSFFAIYVYMHIYITNLYLTNFSVDDPVDALKVLFQDIKVIKISYKT